MAMARPVKYTRVAMAFHWIVATLIVANVVLIWSTSLVSDDNVRPLIDTHKSIGITVLGLAVMRLLWRFANPPPALPASYPAWERWAAHAAHVTLYAVIFFMPLTGWLHDSAWKDAATHPMRLFGLLPWPRIGWVMDVEPATKERLHDLFGLMHTSIAYVLYALFVVHVAGALKHQFVDKEPELQRMLP